jgi:hypothetical protein
MLVTRLLWYLPKPSAVLAAQPGVSRPVSLYNLGTKARISRHGYRSHSTARSVIPEFQFSAWVCGLGALRARGGPAGLEGSGAPVPSSA